MRKFRTFFVLGLLASVMGLFLASCASDSPAAPKDREYFVEVRDGTIDMRGNPTSAKFYRGESVDIVADTPPAGQMFSHWATDSNIRFGDSTASSTFFTMPAGNVTVTAVFKDVEYTVNIVGGRIIFNGSVRPDGSSFIAGNALTIIVDAPPAGREFSHWSVILPNAGLTLENSAESMTSFTMPPGDVRIRAVFTLIDATYHDGHAYVRFAWEAVEQENIDVIAASYNDVKWWKENVYDELLDFELESVTEIPLYDGSAEITDNLFPALGANPVTNKNRYFAIMPGSYTSVCAITDKSGDEWDIVANYTITINQATASSDGADKWFTIGFDVGTFLSGPGMKDLAWFTEEFNNGSTRPTLNKRGTSVTKRIVQGGATMDLTYHVIRRPKK